MLLLIANLRLRIQKRPSRCPIGVYGLTGLLAIFVDLWNPDDTVSKSQRTSTVASGLLIPSSRVLLRTMEENFLGHLGHVWVKLGFMAFIVSVLDM
jgi:hypothetical protein